MKETLKIGLFILIILSLLLACFLPIKFSKSRVNLINNFDQFSSSFSELISTYGHEENAIRKFVLNKNELEQIDGKFMVDSSSLSSTFSSNNKLEQTLTNSTAKNSVTVQEFAKSLNCEISENDNEFILTKKYASKRLIIKSSNPQNKMGAIAMASGYQGWQILQFKTEEETRLAYEYYKTNNDIEFVVIDKPVEVTDSEISPQFLTTKGSYQSWGAKEIGADAYNDFLKEIDTSKKNEVYVAVIDSGIDTDNTYLKNRIDLTHARNYYHQNKVDNYTSDVEDDVNGSGHGTHVAGIVCDLTNENVKIIPIKVLGGSEGTGWLSSASVAILYVASMRESGINVVSANLSLGTDKNNPTPVGSDEHTMFESSFRTAREKGVSVVVASANDNIDGANTCPANVAEAITVASIKKIVNIGIDPDTTSSTAMLQAYSNASSNGYKKSNFSNFGNIIDVCAPGSKIKSTVPSNTMAHMSGTSQATPHVSACLALLCVYNHTQNYSLTNIENLLFENALDLGETTYDGHGLVNLKGLAKIYSITIVQSENGTIAPVGIEQQASNVYVLELGESLTFDILANENCALDSLIVDGKSVETSPTFTFSNVSSSHTISAVFKRTHCWINFTIVGEGNIICSGYNSPTNLLKVPFEEQTNFSFEPTQSNHVVKKVKIDGDEVEISSSYWLTATKASHEVEVEFGLKSYAVIKSLGDGILLTTEQDINNLTHGESVTFTISVDPGYQLDAVFVNDEKIDVTDNTFTISNISEDLEIQVVSSEINPEFKFDWTDKKFMIGVGICAGILILVVIFAIKKKMKKIKYKL